MFATFLINLDKDTDRLKYMDEQLKGQNITYRRQAAIYGKEYKPTQDEYDEKLAIAKTGHALVAGEIGCALSHVQVLQKIVSEKIPYTLVLEDDVSLPLNFKSILEKEIKKNFNGKKWEYLLFDYLPVGIFFLRFWFNGMRYNYSNLKNTSTGKKLVFIVKHTIKALYLIPLSLFEYLRNQYKKKNPGPVVFFRPVYFAGAYLITLEGAEKLLSISRPVVYTADQLPNRARIEKNLRFRCFSPLLVSQQRNTFGSSLLGLSGEEVQKLYSKKFGL